MSNWAAKGTLLKIGDGAVSETFTTISNVVSIGGPGMKMDTLDVTSHSSTEGHKEYVGGLIDGGEVSAEINYDPPAATHKLATGLLKDFMARTIRNFQIVWPDTAQTVWSFAAIVSGFEPAAPVDGKLSASVTLKVTGKVTTA